MKLAEAKQILNNFGSTHEHGLNQYYADFNIKIYNVDLPDDLTPFQREYIENHSDPYESDREYLVDEIQAMPNVVDVEITGRSGGWITVEWDRPSTDDEIIAIAKNIITIKELVSNALDYIRTEEFWRDFVEGIDPTSSENYNPKTKLVTSIVMYTDKTFGVVLTIQRNKEDRKYFYHRDGEVSRLLAVLNSDSYDRQIKLGVSSTSQMYTYFTKK